MKHFSGFTGAETWGQLTIGEVLRIFCDDEMLGEIAVMRDGCETLVFGPYVRGEGIPECAITEASRFIDCMNLTLAITGNRLQVRYEGVFCGDTRLEETDEKYTEYISKHPNEAETPDDLEGYVMVKNHEDKRELHLRFVVVAKE